jgi:hypothetical protein
MEDTFDEIEFVPDVVPDVAGSEQIDPELARLFARWEIGNNYLCDENDDEGEQPEINTKHIKFAFDRFFIMIFCTVLHAFNNAPVVSGSLDSSWSKASTFKPLNIQFNPLKNCENDRVCAHPKPESVPKGVSFMAKNLPEGMKVDKNTGVLTGPASVDVDLDIIVVVKSPGSWFGAPAFEQSVRVVQDASRAEEARIKREKDASMQDIVLDMVATTSTSVLRVVGSCVLDTLFASE